MFFDELTFDSFGVLNDSITLAQDRVNLIHAPNESGKSTLVKGVVAVLYGLVSDRQTLSSSDDLTERDVLEPWGQGPYQLSANIRSKSRDLLVQRNFRDEQVTVHDQSQNADVTDTFENADGDVELGRKLTGLVREVFEKSVLVHQNDMSFEPARGNLVQAIQRMADSTSSNVTAQRAREVLIEARDTFSGRFQQGPVEEELACVKERLEEVDDELHELRRTRERAEKKVERAGELNERIQSIEDELDRIELFETIARKRECEDTLRQHEERKQKLDELIDERQELKQYEGFPHGQQEHLLRSHEKRERLQDQLASRKEEENKIQNELENIREAMHNLHGFRELNSEEVDDLLEFCEQALHYRQELHRSREKLREEKDKVDEHEELLEEYHRLQFVFRDLDADDRAFLSDMDQRLRDLSDRAAESEREISEAEQEIQDIDRERFRIKVRHAILSVGFGLFVGIGGVLLVWLADVRGTLGSLLTLAGITGAGYSVFRWLVADRHRSDERSEWQVKLEHQMQQQKETARKRASLRRRAAILAGTMGLDSVEELHDTYGRYRDLYDKLSSLLEIDAQVQRQEKKLENMHRSREDLLNKSEYELSPSGSVEELEVLKEDLEEYRTYRKRVADLETRQASAWADRSALERKIEVQERNMRSILDRAGIDYEDTTLDDAVDVFSTRHEKYIRLQAVKQKIPAIREGMLSPREREETERIVEQLEEHLDHIRDEWSDVDVPDELGDREQYRSRRNTLDSRKRTLIANHADLEREVGSLERTFRERYADLQDEKEQLKQYRNRLVRLNRSIELAIEVMEQVSRDVHAEWARTLNRDVSDLIERIAPGYSNVRFNADLSFTVTADDREEPLSPVRVRESLSEGTRSQMYLAMRLGLGEFLTETDVSLPIILDESFAQWDDERFKRAWRMITDEFLPDHQIIYLTCHGSRMDWLQEQDPDWFDRNFVEVDL
jgi:DNA repair exonuclease SbcCD ATPase subunit